MGYLRKSRGHDDSYNSGEYVSESRLSEKNLLSFAWMIADGMTYLAENEVYRIMCIRQIMEKHFPDNFLSVVGLISSKICQ